MKPVIGKHKLTIIFIFLAVILDRISKILVATLLPEYMPVRVIGNFFRLIFIKNKGIAFGLFSTWEHSLKTPLKLNAFINGKTVSIIRDNPADKLHLGKEVSLKIYDRREIAAGQSRYQIVQQPNFKSKSKK